MMSLETEKLSAKYCFKDINCFKEVGKYKITFASNLEGIKEASHSIQVEAGTPVKLFISEAEEASQDIRSIALQPYLLTVNFFSLSNGC